MTFGESIRTCFKKYADFSGRASLSEYWWFYLLSFILGCVFGFPTLLGNSGFSFGMIFSSIIGLAIFLPSLAVMVRRLHDTGKSGWWILISLIPFVGWIILIIFLLKPSEPYENRYGIPPFTGY